MALTIDIVSDYIRLFRSSDQGSCGLLGCVDRHVVLVSVVDE
jgi:hypothetical protein